MQALGPGGWVDSVSLVVFSAVAGISFRGRSINTVKVWDTSSGECTKTLKLDRAINVIAVDTSDEYNSPIWAGWAQEESGRVSLGRLG
jgi:hypothetical protein